MSSLPEIRWTPETYLAFERTSETRHEYWDGELYAMSGASRKHSLITVAVLGSLYTQLAKRPCEFYPCAMRVYVPATGLYTYPDISVICGEPEFEDGVHDTLLNPTIIVEVLSPSTERYDRGKKFHDYRTIPSLQEVLLIAQDQPTIEHYQREAEGRWLLTEAAGRDAVLALPSIQCTLALADVYQKISFSD